jgi:hypothetical protein
VYHNIETDCYNDTFPVCIYAKLYLMYLELNVLSLINPMFEFVFFC